MSKTCCFTGHRSIAPQELKAVTVETANAIVSMIERGVDTFLSGGAVGFDLLAARLILRAKDTYPQIKLKMVLPCRDQTAKWGRSDRAMYELVLSQADEIEYTSETYHRGCMLLRNRRMADQSDFCIAYLTHSGGGTAYTVDYCNTHGVEVRLVP